MSRDASGRPAGGANLPVLRRVRDRVVEVLGADLRSLAAFRIVVALLMLADLAIRSTDLRAHYTDKGVLPRDLLLDGVLSPWRFSLNLTYDGLLFQVLFFLVTALAAVSMLVGYRTRLATFVAWVLLLSIQLRNPLVLNSGDILLHLLLFWGMLLPLGARWSVDRALGRVPTRLSPRFFSVATAGLFLQIAFVYWFTAILKDSDEWRVDGTAIYYVLSSETFATQIGSFMLNFPYLLKAMTFATFALEAFGPFLLFFPFFIGMVRTGTVLAFMSLHFGIWLTMDIGIFPWISAFAMVCFLPTWFWDKAVPGVRARLPRRLDAAGRRAAGSARVHWPALKGRVSAMAGAGQTSALGLTARGGDRTGSNAAATQQKGRDGRAARTKKRRMGAAEPEPPMLRSSSLINLLAALSLVCVFSYNLSSVSEFDLPKRADALGAFLGLEQRWAMFSPYPTKLTKWYVILGTLESGRQVDLMSVVREEPGLEELSWEKPENVLAALENKAWRKYLDKLSEEDSEGLRSYFSNYLCREWNESHSGKEELVDLKISYVEERTLLGNRSAAPERHSFSEYSCS